MWIGIATFFCLLSAVIAVLSGVRVYLHVHQWENRVQAVEASNKSLLGKLAAQDKWTREEIRDIVDDYLERREPRESGASDSVLEMMLPAMMQGFAFGPRTPSEAAPEAQPEPEPPRVPHMLGQGGLARNGERE